MSDDPRGTSARTGGPADEVESLFRLAGRRPGLPEEEVAPIRAAAHAAWSRAVRRRARRRAGIAAALAAALLLALGLAFRGRLVPQPRSPLGEVEMESGEVALSRPDGEVQDLTAGSVITTGGDGRAALRLAAGPSVRLDVATVLRIEAPGRLALERGALYVDAKPASIAGSAIEVATPLGSVRHLGTQFEVRLLAGEGGTAAGRALALRVRVREGAVLVARAGKSYEARAGGEVTVHADGRATRGAASIQGPSWDWVQRTAPPLEVEGETLATFLDWVSRETGLPWRFAEPGLARSAQDVVLHGTIAGLTPEEALSVVLPGCGLRHRRIEGALLLEPATEQ
jgi:hypothetical protein